MTQHILTSNQPGMTVLIGWDRPLCTYYARVFGTDADGELDSKLWIGNRDGEITEPEVVIDAVRAYGAIPDGLIAALRLDKTSSSFATSAVHNRVAIW